MAEEYTIVAQGQGYATNAIGQLVDVWRVTALTNPEGYSISVDIPLATYRANPTGSVASAVAPMVAAAQASGAL